MLIRYIHAADPKKEKVHNTQKAYRNSSWIFTATNSQISQEEYDQTELSNFKRDKKKGLILSYTVLT